MAKQNNSALAYCLTLLKRDKSVIQILQKAECLFVVAIKDIDVESKNWIENSNIISKEK